jgi:hypothetical protein
LHRFFPPANPPTTEMASWLQAVPPDR